MDSNEIQQKNSIELTNYIKLKRGPQNIVRYAGTRYININQKTPIFKK